MGLTVATVVSRIGCPAFTSAGGRLSGRVPIATGAPTGANLSALSGDSIGGGTAALTGWGDDES